MLKDLVKLANRLDSKGLRKEADYLDAIVKAASLEGNLELLDEAMATLDALRREMDPDFSPDYEDEDEPKDEWETETAWNALHKSI